MAFVKSVNILLIEDNPGDVFLIEKALRDCKFNNGLYVARDGEEAIDFLRKRGKFEDAVDPDLILLDLNLPKKDGREVLEEIKKDKKLHKTPVIIMTSSSAEEDVAKAYNLNANCYIKKPIDLKQFVNIVKAIDTFWLSIVTLPTVE